jgi:hypothetical protein
MEVPMDMVERVRAALVAELSKDMTNCVSDYRAEGGDDELFIDGNFNGSALARAAIAAMREPTEKMVRAGEKEFIASDVACCMEPAEDCWQAMIDAALTSSEKP